MPEEKHDGRTNLLPLNKRSEDEVKKITSAGGKASAEARRKKGR